MEHVIELLRSDHARKIDQQNTAREEEWTRRRGRHPVDEDLPF
jgi:hypothetical protein